MAKIIKQGTLPATDKKWPIGLRVTCANCHCEWEVETSNDYISLTDKKLLSLQCPVCGKRTEVKDERQKTNV